MRPRRLVLAAVAVLACAAPARAQTLAKVVVPRPSPTINLSVRALADELESADPARELKRALAHGNRRLMAVCGYACILGGMADYAQRDVDRFEWSIVPGTTDAPAGPDGVRLNNVAWAFSARYNRLLMKHFGYTPQLRPKKRSRT